MAVWILNAKIFFSTVALEKASMQTCCCKHSQSQSSLTTSSYYIVLYQGFPTISMLRAPKHRYLLIPLCKPHRKCYTVQWHRAFRALPIMHESSDKPKTLSKTMWPLQYWFLPTAQSMPLHRLRFGVVVGTAEKLKIQNSILKFSTRTALRCKWVHSVCSVLRHRKPASNLAKVPHQQFLFPRRTPASYEEHHLPLHGRCHAHFS